MNLIAQKINTERTKKGMTEKALAKKCGLSENYIKQVEAGKKVINEQAAQKILNVLDVDTDLLQQGANLSRIEEEVTRQRTIKTKEIDKEQHYIEPNQQWSDALAHIIKEFPVEDIVSGKQVGKKTLPMLGKKSEGFAWDSIRFVRVTDNLLQSFRIHQDDIVMIGDTTQIINGKCMLIELNGRRMIRKIWKVNQNTINLSPGVNEHEVETVKADQVKVLGQCIKVEFYL